MLEEKAKVPAVGADDQNGKRVDLRKLAGRSVVVYFYPKANTPGCTAETQAFRDLNSAFEKAGTTIVGVSRDTIADQKKFADKFGVQFSLLADTSSQVCDAFGVIVEKNMYGKKSMGIQRATFLIGPDGTVVKRWPRVSVEGHAAAVLEAVKAQ
jgi:peroxiredoxin Q/BCP